MTGEAAGRKREVPARSLSPYTLYDTCNKCPLWAYVELVCNNNPRALTVEGEPPESALEDAGISLTAEFSELSGNADASDIHNTMKNIRIYRMHIQILTTCLCFCFNGKTEDARRVLKQVDINIPGDPEDALKRIEGFIKSKSILLKKEIDRYEKLVSGNKGNKPTVKYYNQQLAVLSVHFKFNIDMNVTLAAFASYLKIFENHVLKS